MLPCPHPFLSLTLLVCNTPPFFLLLPSSRDTSINYSTAPSSHAGRNEMRRDTPITEGQDMLQMEQLPEADEQGDRHQQHPSPFASSIAAHQDSRSSGSGRDASSPQPGEAPQIEAPGTQAGRGGELAQSATAEPGMHEGLGASMAPAFGGALEAPEDTHRREKVRWGWPVHCAVLPSYVHTYVGDAARLCGTGCVR